MSALKVLLIQFSTKPVEEDVALVFGGPAQVFYQSFSASETRVNERGRIISVQFVAL